MNASSTTGWATIPNPATPAGQVRLAGAGLSAIHHHLACYDRPGPAWRHLRATHPAAARGGSPAHGMAWLTAAHRAAHDPDVDAAAGVDLPGARLRPHRGRGPGVPGRAYHQQMPGPVDLGKEHQP